MNYSKFTELCKHHYSPILEHFYHSKMVLLAICSYPTLSVPALGNPHSIFCLYRLFTSCGHFTEMQETNTFKTIFIYFLIQKIKTYLTYRTAFPHFHFSKCLTIQKIFVGYHCHIKQHSLFLCFINIC